MSYSCKCPISELIGKVLTWIVDEDGNVPAKSSDEIHFTCADGARFKMHHQPDCCECVSIEDVIGDFADLIGEPLTLAEKSTNSDTHPEGHVLSEYGYDSFTWTFYRLATRKGHVDIRWLGESNGYYSEDVDFERVKDPQP